MSIEGDTSWMARRACGTADPEIFHPIGTPSREDSQVQEARALCFSCPVRQECLGYAITERLSGIWGGTLFDEGQEVELRDPDQKLPGLPRVRKTPQERREQIIRIASGPQRT